MAAQNGYLAIVQALIKHRANVNQVRTDGWSALHVAADSGFVDVCSALIDANASLTHLTAKRGASPLHTAARRGHTSTLDLLLNAKADAFFARKEDGTTALMLASRNGFDDSVRRLLKAGLKHEALTSSRREGVEGTNALMFGALLGRDAVVRTLLAAGVSPLLVDGQGENVLHYTAKGGWLTTLLVILEQATDLHALTQQRGRRGKQPIDTAREYDHGAIVALLEKIQPASGLQAGPGDRGISLTHRRAPPSVSRNSTSATSPLSNAGSRQSGFV